jgi:hypothetical protein
MIILYIKPMGAWRQTIADAGVHVETPDLEIDHAIRVMLLLVERQPESSCALRRQHLPCQ